MHTYLRAGVLAALSLTLTLCLGCTSDDDDEGTTPVEQALVAQTHWTHGADPGLNDQPRGRLNWFPRQATLGQQEIHPGWPHNEEVTLLEVVHQPFAFLAGSTTHYNPSSWTSLTSRMTLDTLTTVLEWKMLFASLPNAGTLIIDIGEFSEDQLPNSRFDTEDMNDDNRTQASENLGLDGMTGVDAPWPLPVELVGWSGSLAEMQAQFGAVYDWWDIDQDSLREVNEPWSLDDWSPADESDPLAGNPTGCEGNALELLDSEDLDGDKQVNTADNFLRYTFPLDPAAPTQDAAITQLYNSEWLQLSLQLERAHTTVGTPDLSGPVRVRVSFTGFNGPAVLYLTWFDWR
jgi:hypothetical protein